MSVKLPTELWNHDRTANFLGVPEDTLHQWNYLGVGPRSYKVGRYRRYAPEDLAEWLAQRVSRPGTTVPAEPAPSDAGPEGAPSARVRRKRPAA